MIAVRLAGWVALVVGLMVLVRDVLVWFDTARWLPMDFAEAGRLTANFRLFTSSASTGPVAALWLCPILLLVGAVLLWWGRRRFRYRPS